MNRFLTTILLLILPLCLVAQDREERKVGSFNEVKVGQAIKVYLHQSNNERVVIESSNIDIDEVETEVESGRLRISLSGNRYRSVQVRVDVYYRNLQAISSSSASSIYGDDIIKGDDFEISVSSAGSVDVKLDVNQLEVKASSSGDAKIAGKAHEVEISVSSAGGVNAYDLLTEIADLSASSAGSVKINVTKSIEARASSGGSIKYKGNPARSNTNSSSGGSVKRSD